MPTIPLAAVHASAQHAPAVRRVVLRRGDDRVRTAVMS
ncbi:hypothetical protein RS86_01431 [Microbacterium azadirachtae]|uniref:Uncharacterized protein n=1 Tax=Microbacterium azadirachtae TaxID=582680 RepID=A0A0F0LMT7_9MICO|nr:hypothetical protein RS86_01431 [Microbacterium azadirachtae]